MVLCPSRPPPLHRKRRKTIVCRRVIRPPNLRPRSAFPPRLLLRWSAASPPCRISRAPADARCGRAEGAIPVGNGFLSASHLPVLLQIRLQPPQRFRQQFCTRAARAADAQSHGLRAVFGETSSSTSAAAAAAAVNEGDLGNVSSAERGGSKVSSDRGASTHSS